MEELKILLARQRDDLDSVCVLPVWHGIEYQQCCSLERVYDTEVWVGGEPKPAQQDLLQWAKTARELLQTTAVREDQVGQQAHIGRVRAAASSILFSWACLDL